MFFSLLGAQTVLTILNDANIVPLYCARENKAIATEPSYKGRAQTSVSSPWKQPQRQTSSQIQGTSQRRKRSVFNRVIAGTLEGE